MSDVISEIQRDYICNLLQKDERSDGRALDEYREISVETDVIDKAEGSARVRIGDTQVVVGVKMQLGEPFPDTPDKGVIIINVELGPLASPLFEAGPPRENAIELARVTDRGIRESGAIDLSKLCIEVGEKVWLIFIDVHVLDDNGNIMDAAALGAIAALLTTKIPHKRYETGKKDEPLSIQDVPVAITAVELDGKILFDPGLYEEGVASTKLTVIFNGDGDISGMQKSGACPLTEEQIMYIVDTAVDKAKSIRETYLKKV